MTWAFPTRRVEVDGETYHARALSAGQTRAALAAKSAWESAGAGDEEVGLRFLEIACLFGACDEHGARLFSDDQGEEVAEAPIAVVKAVGEAVLAASGLGEDDSGN